MKNRIAVLAVIVAALALSGTASSAPATGGKNIVQVAVAAGQFKTLVSLVQRAGLASTLAKPGAFTLFAPTDAAFAKVPKATLDALTMDKAKLRSVLLYHVVAGKVPAATVVKLTSAKTLEGQSVKIRVTSAGVFVNTAKVTKTDIAATNGLIHVLNQVLIPPAKG